MLVLLALGLGSIQAEALIIYCIGGEGLPSLEKPCSRKNCEWFEYAGSLTEGIGIGIKHPIKLDDDGCVAPTGAPGLGVELDWDQIDPQIVAEL